MRDFSRFMMSTPADPAAFAPEHSASMRSLWPAWAPGPDHPPPHGANCSRCSGSAWCTEGSGRRFGWRCCACCPVPDQRGDYTVVDTGEHRGSDSGTRAETRILRLLRNLARGRSAETRSDAAEPPR